MDNALPKREGAIDLRIRTAVAGGRFDNWREAFARAFLRLDVEPRGERFSTDISLRAMPGLGIGSITTSACSLVRTRELLADGQDDIGLVALISGHGRARDLKGNQVDLRPGEAIFLRNGSQGAVDYSDGTQHLCFTLPQAVFKPFVTDPDAACMRVIQADKGPLGLMLRYAQMLVADGNDPATQAGPAIARHMHELAAMVMSGSPGLVEEATGRSARAAARLAAIKTEIMGRLADSSLSITSVARKLGITPRYIAQLFAQDGTSFTAFVLEQRLGLVHGLLADPARDGFSIGTLALAAGFGDISYFNKCFRRRYGMTPSEVRQRS